MTGCIGCYSTEDSTSGVPATVIYVHISCNAKQKRGIHAVHKGGAKVVYNVICKRKFDFGATFMASMIDDLFISDIQRGSDNESLREVQ